MKQKIKLANLVALYFSYFSKMQSRENDKKLYEHIKVWFKYNYSDSLIQYFLKKHGYLKMNFVELDILYLANKEEFDKFKYPVRRVMLFCNSCGTATSNTKYSEIIEQTHKYGIFICKHCEKNAIKFIPSGSYLISYNGIYKDEGVSNPKDKMLGFGGRWFLIKTDKKIWITNNLFSINDFHEKLQKYYAKNINSAVTFIKNKNHLLSLVNDEELAEIKNNNNGLSFNYFSN